jgi:hypothetical protein
MEAALFTILTRGYDAWMSPEMLVGDLLGFLVAVGYSLALASAVLLLPLFWQQRQRVWFTILLVMTLVLVFTQDSGWLDMLLWYSLFRSRSTGLPTPAGNALGIAIHSAPSALLALAVLGCSWISGRTARLGPALSDDETALEVHIESLHSPSAD